MSLTVLVVDDSAVTRAVIKKSLSMAGLEIKKIYEAANGLEALKVLEEAWIDLVFADLQMPEMNGVELVERMARDSLLVTIPVVVVSADPNQQRADELAKLGVRAFIRKPFRPEGLKQIVSDVLTGGGGTKP